MQSSGITKCDLLLVSAAVLVGMSATVGLVGWLLFASRPEAPAVADPTAPAGEHALQVPEVASPPAEGSSSLPVVDLAGTVQRVDLPNRLADLSIAANGRLLVLRLEESPTLKVYDVITRKFVGEIPANDDPVCFASGRDKLVLGLWGHSAIQRWDLTTCQLEAERLVVGDEAPIGLAMGADSGGPFLLVKHGGGSDLVDLQTLQTMELEIDRRRRTWKHYPSSQHRVSASGRVFCAWDYQTLIAGVNVLTVEEGRATYAAFSDSVGHVCPNDDGSYLFTAVGRYRVDERPDHLGQPAGFVIPAVSGPFFIRVQAGSASQSARFTLFTSEEPQRPLATIAGLQFAHVQDIQVRHAFDTKLQMPLAPDRRLILIPAARQLVTVAGDLRSLQHWPFDFGRWP